jgi:hypothetical protein
LLERQVERIGDFRLGQAKHQAAHSYLLSDVGVNWVGPSFGIRHSSD